MDNPEITCPECGSFRCLACGKGFPTDKKLALHQITHHRWACKHCGEVHAKKGLEGHESRCTANPYNDLDRMYPATRSQLCDFLDHCLEIPQGTLLVVTKGQEPAFFSVDAGLRAAFQSKAPAIIIPAACVPELTEASRLRRKEQTEPDDFDDDYEPEPVKVSGGIDWGDYT